MSGFKIKSNQSSFILMFKSTTTLTDAKCMWFTENYSVDNVTQADM